MSIHTHYNSLSPSFNTLWQFSPEYKDFVIHYIKEDLELSPNDILADIGGGTGTFTQRLSQESALSCAYCVEPSALINHAQSLQGITPICADAQTFITQNRSYTKVLFKEVIHHLNDRPTLWKAFYNQIPTKGKLLIITRPKEVGFPLFSAAKEAFKAHQPAEETLIAELLLTGFSMDVHKRTHTFELSKETWFQMLENRFLSDLSVFSNKEIALGLNELDSVLKDIVEINDTLIFITATKE